MTDRIVSAILESQQKLRDLSGQALLRAALLSPQRRQFCSDEIMNASIAGIDFDVLPDMAEAARRPGLYDVCILCCHNEGEEAILLNLRNLGFARFYAVWLWDNHHHHEASFRTAILADTVSVSHWHERDYLNHPLILPGPHMPACSRQWSSALIDRVYPEGLPVARQDALFGGFGRYQWLPARNAFIERMMEQCPDNALSLGPVESYFQQPIEERLREWAGHKIHLAVPVAGDLSTRVFEALITGQIPLVPTDVADLDRVVPAALQASLPILRYQSHSIESAEAAWLEALVRFDAEGTAGVARRHLYAREHHCLASRLGAFASFLRHPGVFVLGSDGRRVQWETWK